MSSMACMANLVTGFEKEFEIVKYTLGQFVTDEKAAAFCFLYTQGFIYAQTNFISKDYNHPCKIITNDDINLGTLVNALMCGKLDSERLKYTIENNTFYIDTNLKNSNKFPSLNFNLIKTIYWDPPIPKEVKLLNSFYLNNSEIFKSDETSNIYSYSDTKINLEQIDQTSSLSKNNSQKVRELNYYDLAISFAGEDREIAESIARKLKDLGYNIFYDKYEKANLWGKDLYSHLNDIYSKKAKYCLMIISENYAKKHWTNHERQAAQAKAFSQNEEYILPLRLDNIEIPGLNITVGYVSYHDTGFEETINLLIDKIKQK